MDTPLKGIYDLLPAALQNLAVSGFSAILDRQRYGGRFEEYRDFLREEPMVFQGRTRDLPGREAA